MVEKPWKKPSETDSGGVMAGLVDELLLIKPLKYEDDLPSRYNNKDGSTQTYDKVTADIVVINLKKPDKSEKHEEVAITQGRLIGKLKGEIGQLVLGTLTRDKPTKSEPNPPYDLEDPDDEDGEAAEAFLAGSSEPPF